jgi:hypothetical protein
MSPQHVTPQFWILGIVSWYPYFKTYSFITLIPLKIISFSNTALLPLPFPLLEVLFRWCSLNHSQFICCICNDVLYNLKHLGIIFTWGNRNNSEGIGQAYREVVEGQYWNDLPRTFELRRLWACVLPWWRCHVPAMHTARYFLFTASLTCLRTSR